MFQPGTGITWVIIDMEPYYSFNWRLIKLALHRILVTLTTGKPTLPPSHKADAGST